jgi:hypothetical protein
VPRIIVVSDVTGSEPQVLLSERIDAAHLASKHSRDQLAERVEWAVADAHHLEHAHHRRANPNGSPGEPSSVVFRQPAGLRRSRGLTA